MPPRIGVAHDTFPFHSVNHATRSVKTNPEASLEEGNRGLPGLANNPLCFAIKGFVFIGDVLSIAQSILSDFE